MFQVIREKYPQVGRVINRIQYLAGFLGQRFSVNSGEMRQYSGSEGGDRAAEAVTMSANPHTQNDFSAEAVATAIADRDRRNVKAMERLSDTGRADWPPVYADPFPDLKGVVPEIDAAALTADVMGGAVAHHGLLLVRGLFSPEQVADTRAVQDHMKAASPLDESDGSGWYVPFNKRELYEKVLRSRAEGLGGNWLADSPIGLGRVMGHFEATGVVDVIKEHFQERPAFSLEKLVLRAVQPKSSAAGWHQDGRFLGDDVRAMNVWVALSPCGGSHPAPGLELIPRRFEEIFAIDPSIGRVAISFEMAESISKETPAVLPEFAAGDALMFDERLLHRTYLGSGLTEVRYALECWFFAPSHAASKYVPFLA